MLNVLLSILCTTMIKHEYVLSKIVETAIIPVIKNKSGDATDKHKYRPIAISTTMSKVLELVMLHTIDSCLIPRHLTESTIGAYLKNNSLIETSLSP